MGNRKVISSKNLPYPSPIWTGAVLYLLFDKWNAPSWAYGAAGLLWLLLLIVWIIDLGTRKTTEILKDK